MSDELDEYAKVAKKIYDLLIGLLEEIRAVLAADDAEWVGELTYVGEPLLALVTLVAGLELAECEIDRGFLERLKKAAELMDSNDNTLFKFLEKQVREKNVRPEMGG